MFSKRVRFLEGSTGQFCAAVARPEAHLEGRQRRQGQEIGPELLCMSPEGFVPGWSLPRRAVTAEGATCRSRTKPVPPQHMCHGTHIHACIPKCAYIRMYIYIHIYIRVFTCIHACLRTIACDSAHAYEVMCMFSMLHRGFPPSSLRLLSGSQHLRCMQPQHIQCSVNIASWHTTGPIVCSFAFRPRGAAKHGLG